MPYLVVTAVTLGLGAGAYIYSSQAGRDWRSKLAAALIPITVIMFLLQIIASILQIPQISWNDPRLARTVGLLHGYALYYGPETDGPIIGTLHNPLSQLMYVVVGWLGEPVQAMLAASCLSFVFIFAPLVWLHLSGNRLWPVYALLACGLVMQQNSAMRYSMFSIHADAAAFGFATLAAGFFYKRAESYSWRADFVAALCAVLAVWCKQTMVMVPLALLAFVWLAYGMRRAWLFCVALAAVGTAVSAVMLAIFWPPHAMLFNTFTMARQLPVKPFGDTSILTGFKAIKENSPYTTIPVLFLLFYLGATRQGSWREIFPRNRWLAFAIIGLFMLPVSLIAGRTIGGDSNHLSLFSFFLLVGASLGMCQAFDKQEAGRTAKIFVVILIILNVDLTAFSTAANALAKLDDSPSRIAYRYNQNHPGRVYFPWNPLAVLMSEGKLYHFDYALFDREIRGYSLRQSEVKKNLPQAPELLALPPNEFLVSTAVLRMIRGKVQITEPGLDGWTVFQLR